MAHVSPQQDAAQTAHQLAASLGYTNYRLEARGVPNPSGRAEDAGWNEIVLIDKGTNNPLDLKGKTAPRYRGIVNAH
jgi:hypothetical protein